MTIKYWISAHIIHILGLPLRYLPYKAIQKLGQILGTAAYYLSPKHRKRVLNNLAIAENLNIPKEEHAAIAKASFQNLIITSLEYFRLPRSKKRLHEIVSLEDEESFLKYKKNDKGFVLFSGHQANWEVPFLELTRLMPGIAIGRPIKNFYFYQWIQSIRQMFGGIIIPPQNAIAKSMEAISEGKFVGLVSDQAFPGSSYSYPFFGVRAWASPGPALLAYKSNTPLIVVTTRREGHHYRLYLSDPIIPDQSKSLKSEIKRMMDTAFSILENSIAEAPEQYLWQHNLWKQQGVNHVEKKYRHDYILVMLPDDEEQLHLYLPSLDTLKEIYPRSFLHVLYPSHLRSPSNIEGWNVHLYDDENALLLNDRRIQMVIDFTNNKAIRKHYKKLCAFEVLNVGSLNKESRKHPQYNKGQGITQDLIHALCKKD